MNSPDQSMQNQERLIGDLRQVIENAEDLLKNTDKYHSQLYQTARAKLTQALQTATEELARVEDAQLSRMIEATASAADLHQDSTGEARLMRAFRLPPG